MTQGCDIAAALLSNGFFVLQFFDFFFGKAG